MANQYDITIIEEGHRNAVVRIAGVLDTNDLSLTPAVAVSAFKNNDPTQSALVGFRVDTLQYAVQEKLIVALYWAGNNPQLIATVADSQALKFKDAGGLQPDQTRSGYTGDINLETRGYAAGTVAGFTVVLSLVKLYRF